MKTLFSLALIALSLSACGIPSLTECGPLTCDGCCDTGGHCQMGSSSTVCGGHGNFCDACTGTQQCVSSTCTFVSAFVDAGARDSGVVTMVPDAGRLDAGDVVTMGPDAGRADAGQVVLVDAGSSCFCDTSAMCTGSCSCDPDCAKTVDCGPVTFDTSDAGTVAMLRSVALTSTGGWAVGENETLLHLVDGGWRKVRAPEADTDPQYSLNSIRLIDDSNGWAVGTWRVAVGGTTYSYGLALVLTNGTWTLKQSSLGFGLNAIDLIDGSNGWAVGVFGQLTQISAGSYSPLFGTPCYQTTFNAVDVVDSMTGWAGGNIGKLCKLANGVWKPIDGPDSSSIYGLALSDSLTGWAVGSNGAVWRMTGGTWVAQQPVTNRALRAVTVDSAGTVWADGELDTVVRNTGSGWVQCRRGGSGALSWAAISSSSRGVLAVGSGARRAWL